MTDTVQISISKEETLVLIESHQARANELAEIAKYADTGTYGSSARVEKINDQIRSIQEEIEKLKKRLG